MNSLGYKLLQLWSKQPLILIVKAIHLFLNLKLLLFVKLQVTKTNIFQKGNWMERISTCLTLNEMLVDTRNDLDVSFLHAPPVFWFPHLLQRPSMKGNGLLLSLTLMSTHGTLTPSMLNHVVTEQSDMAGAVNVATVSNVVILALPAGQFGVPPSVDPGKYMYRPWNTQQRNILTSLPPANQSIVSVMIFAWSLMWCKRWTWEEYLRDRP